MILICSTNLQQIAITASYIYIYKIYVSIKKIVSRNLVVVPKKKGVNYKGYKRMNNFGGK